jgi:hypothetical protein
MNLRPMLKVVISMALVVIGIGISFADTTVDSWADQTYRNTFVKDKFPDSVLTKIADVDNNKLHFNKITYTQTVTIKGIASGSIKSADGDVTVIDQGGPFETTISTDHLADNDTMITFEFGYRGIMVLRDQKIFPDRPVSARNGRVPKPYSDITEIKNVSSISSPEQKTNSILELSMDAGTIDQWFHYKKLKRTCEPEDEFVASSIAPEFSGNAVRLKCVLYDELNHPLNGYEEKLFLQDYGVALKSKIVSPQVEIDYEIKNAHIE